MRSSLSSKSPVPSLSQSILYVPIGAIERSMVPSSSPIQSTFVLTALNVGPLRSEIAIITLSLHKLSSVTVIT